MSWLHLQPRPLYLMLMFPISHWLPIAFHCSARLLPSRSTPTQWWWRELQLKQIRSKRSTSWVKWATGRPWKMLRDIRGEREGLFGSREREGKWKSHTRFTGRERELKNCIPVFWRGNWNFPMGKGNLRLVFRGIPGKRERESYKKNRFMVG